MCVAILFISTSSYAQGGGGGGRGGGRKSTNNSETVAPSNQTNMQVLEVW